MKRNIDNYEIPIEELRSIMDRIIGIIERYFTKTSIVLGFWGIVISFFTDSPFLRIAVLEVRLLKSNHNLYYIVLFIFTVVATVVFVIGVLFLILTLIAKAPVTKNHSKLFYADIASNENIKSYRNTIINSSLVDIKSDYINQIYINAIFCKQKNRWYNLGLYLSFIGFFLFLITQVLIILLFII